MTGFNVGARVRRDLCVSDNPKRLELSKALPEREAQISLSLKPGRRFRIYMYEET
jgi:hypothetical protein